MHFAIDKIAKHQELDNIEDKVPVSSEQVQIAWLDWGEYIAGIAEGSKVGIGIWEGVC